MSYTERERMHDLRRVVGALERGGRDFVDDETEQAARRLERLSSLSVLELVVRVQRTDINLGLRPEPAVEVLSPTHPLGRGVDEARLP